MLAEVQTGLFVLWRNSQQVGRLEDVEQDRHRDKCPYANDYGAVELYPNVTVTSQSLGDVLPQDTGCQATPDAAQTVYGPGTNGVIDFQLFQLS